MRYSVSSLKRRIQTASRTPYNRKEKEIKEITDSLKHLKASYKIPKTRFKSLE